MPDIDLVQQTPACYKEPESRAIGRDETSIDGVHSKIAPAQNGSD
jgi:hypothetical protein